MTIEMGRVALVVLGAVSAWLLIKALQWAVWNLIPTAEEDE